MKKVVEHVQSNRLVGLPVCRSAGLQVCQSAGLQVCQSAGRTAPLTLMEVVPPPNKNVTLLILGPNGMGFPRKTFCDHVQR
jgi:hypothetical protein